MTTGLLVGTLCLMACGNSDDSDTVSRAMYNELQEQYDMLKEQVEGTLSTNEQARMDLNNIMAELNTISGRTMRLHTDVENGKAANGQQTVEQIHEAINAIKDKLARVPTASIDKQTQALLNHLRQTVAMNEMEITRLNDVISQKDQQITHLDEQLTQTSTRLEQAESNLQQAEIDQWVAMGNQLVEAAGTLPNVKGHGNMKPVKEAKQTMLLRAKECYERARTLGAASTASRIANAEQQYREASED